MVTYDCGTLYPGMGGSECEDDPGCYFDDGECQNILNNTECYAIEESCASDDECESDYCDACGECKENFDCFYYYGPGWTGDAGAGELACIADPRCDHAPLGCYNLNNFNPEYCHNDGVSCASDDECASDYCDVCGECGIEEAVGMNPVSCLADDSACSEDNECASDSCDACGECNGDNPINCFADGESCSEDNECESGDCDACGECGGDNLVFCYVDGVSCSIADVTIISFTLICSTTRNSINIAKY
jgi:hypothetical protein